MINHAFATATKLTGLPLELSVHNPGDGTRYQLQVRDGGGVRNLGHYVSASEMYSSLYMLNNVLEEQKRSK